MLGFRLFCVPDVSRRAFAGIPAVRAISHWGMQLISNPICEPTRVSRLAIIVALAACALAVNPANARSRHRHAAPATAVDASLPKWTAQPVGPVIFVVSIADQRLTLYDNGVPVARSTVSTGVAGHLTPRGIFTIIQKDRYHRSNIYSNAPMPYMQRITWSGVALHEGHVTGRQASHGCIRMPHDFAARLWPYTKIGMRVIVSDTDITPAEFSHPNLFAAAKHPTTAAIEPAKALRFAQVHTDSASDAIAAPAKPDIASAPDATPAPAGSVATAAQPAIIEAPKAEATNEHPAEATTPVAPEVKSADAGTSPVEEKPAATADAAAEQATPTAGAPASSAAVEHPVETTAPVKAADAEPTKPAPEAVAVAPIETKPEAKTDNAPEAPATVAALPPAPVTPETTPRAQAPAPIVIPPGPGHVSMFISKKTGKLYVRRNFAPIFETPVVIRDPATPLGSHLFTAMEIKDEGSNVRWTSVDVHDKIEEIVQRRRKGQPAPEPVVPSQASSAAEALDRVIIPEDARVAMADLIVPGTSLIISDQGFGRETGKGTDFIVLTR